MKLDASIVREAVLRALTEDVGGGDVTTLAVIGEAEELSAEISAREDCIVAGLPVARVVYAQLDPRVRLEGRLEEGAWVGRGDILALVSGPARPILTGERTALNFLQHLSGIATLTRRFVEAVEGTGVTLLDTRKTIPGMRYLEKYAVAAGGGMNHRMGLHDGVLIKDNHIRIQERYGADAVGKAIALVRERYPDEPVEVEARSIEEVRQALEAGADRILLDNMTADEIREAVTLIDRRAETEASGGVTLENVREIALTGVHYISIGRLTHSARAVDMSMTVAG